MYVCVYIYIHNSDALSPTQTESFPGFWTRLLQDGNERFAIGAPLVRRSCSCLVLLTQLPMFRAYALEIVTLS